MVDSILLTVAHYTTNIRKQNDAYLMTKARSSNKLVMNSRGKKELKNSILIA